jgi:glycerate kinase
VLAAPNAFKGSLTAGDAARALARGARKSIRPFPQIRLCPLADGGDDTLEVLSGVFGARPRRARVTGPLGRPLQARWAYASGRRLAVIEMGERDWYGTGVHRWDKDGTRVILEICDIWPPVPLLQKQRAEEEKNPA